MSRHRRRSPESVRAGYLRELGNDVAAGLALVVHDLIATGVLAPAEAETAVRIRAEEHLADVRGHGLPVTAQDTAVWVAEAVQEDLIEGRAGGERLVTWPPCPDHPRHPLWLRPDVEVLADGRRVVGDEAWTCITAPRRVAELGGL